MFFFGAHHEDGGYRQYLRFLSFPPPKYLGENPPSTGRMIKAVDFPTSAYLESSQPVYVNLRLRIEKKLNGLISTCLNVELS